eukprot:CAMPEP_0197857136 /NCGR_PEP_ID=MMETSP1438-20131217/29921_1 /TAXON_ID=1461541 /ORGANISM="Pterosperma sp., Strain CCMP1384" /LENGTH=864 /DNA_ID=CAMNT_0043472855 /DNA_START=193 /DNA_END=2784 /DNA_ORIENTATION=+
MGSLFWRKKQTTSELPENLIAKQPGDAWLRGIDDTAYFTVVLSMPLSREHTVCYQWYNGHTPIKGATEGTLAFKPTRDAGHWNSDILKSREWEQEIFVEVEVRDEACEKVLRKERSRSSILRPNWIEALCCLDGPSGPPKHVTLPLHSKQTLVLEEDIPPQIRSLCKWTHSEKGIIDSAAGSSTIELPRVKESDEGEYRCEIALWGQLKQFTGFIVKINRDPPVITSEFRLSHPDVDIIHVANSFLHQGLTLRGFEFTSKLHLSLGPGISLSSSASTTTAAVAPKTPAEPAPGYSEESPSATATTALEPSTKPATAPSAALESEPSTESAAESTSSVLAPARLDLDLASMPELLDEALELIASNRHQASDVISHEAAGSSVGVPQGGDLDLTVTVEGTARFTWIKRRRKPDSSRRGLFQFDSDGIDPKPEAFDGSKAAGEELDLKDLTVVKHSGAHQYHVVQNKKRTSMTCTLRLTNVQASDEGSYQCICWSEYGISISQSSGDILIRQTSQPVIKTQPNHRREPLTFVINKPPTAHTTPTTTTVTTRPCDERKDSRDKISNKGNGADTSRRKESKDQIEIVAMSSDGEPLNYEWVIHNHPHTATPLLTSLAEQQPIGDDPDEDGGSSGDADASPQHVRSHIARRPVLVLDELPQLNSFEVGYYDLRCMVSCGSSYVFSDSVTLKVAQKCIICLEDICPERKGCSENGEKERTMVRCCPQCEYRCCCTECVRNYLKHQVAQDSPPVLNIQCPSDTCHHPVTEDFIRDYTTREEYQSWKNKRIVSHAKRLHEIFDLILKEDAAAAIDTKSQCQPVAGTSQNICQILGGQLFSKMVENERSNCPQQEPAVRPTQISSHDSSDDVHW